MSSLGGTIYDLGVLLQIVGVVLGAILLVGLHEKVTGNASWFRRMWRRLHRTPAPWRGGGAIITLRAHAKAWGRQPLLESIPNGLDSDDRVAWVWAQVRLVDDKAEAAQKAARDLDRKVDATADRLGDEMKKAVADARMDARQLVYEGVAAGIGREIVSLLCVAAGIALAAWAEGWASMVRWAVPGI